MSEERKRYKLNTDSIEKLMYDISMFLYVNHLSKVEFISHLNYDLGATITTKKFYLLIKSKLIKFKFPELPYLKFEKIEGRYIFEYDFSVPEDDVDSKIINHPTLDNSEKLMLLYSLRSDKLLGSIPISVKQKYININS